jgi:hypothetical protein
VLVNHGGSHQATRPSCWSAPSATDAARQGSVCHPWFHCYCSYCRSLPIDNQLISPRRERMVSAGSARFERLPELWLGLLIHSILHTSHSWRTSFVPCQTQAPNIPPEPPQPIIGDHLADKSHSLARFVLTLTDRVTKTKTKQNKFISSFFFIDVSPLFVFTAMFVYLFLFSSRDCYRCCWWLRRTVVDIVCSCLMLQSLLHCALRLQVSQYPCNSLSFFSVISVSLSLERSDRQ